jgi:hypothetical protein
MHLAMDIGVQPAEIRHARGRAHAAEKAVALDQQRAATGARSRDRPRRCPRVRPRGRRLHIRRRGNLARGFFDGFDGQEKLPYRWVDEG